jgi:ABC-type iron transport system FetAB permease component
MVKLIALAVLIVLGFVMIGTILKAAAWIGLIVVLVMVAHAGYSALTKSSKT